jgi:hypothetical protein
MTPTERTLKEMRRRGYVCAVVEKWNAHIKLRQDLFGFIDILCLGDGEIIGVQATSADNVSKRIAKIAEHENTPHVRKSGMRILVHGWRKGKRGAEALREIDVS